MRAKPPKRADLQLRMQGNTFLGAFFKVSSFLKDHNIGEEEYSEIVRNQYEKKFGRFGDAVVESNMKVMVVALSVCRKSRLAILKMRTLQACATRCCPPRLLAR